MTLPVPEPETGLVEYLRCMEHVGRARVGSALLSTRACKNWNQTYPAGQLHEPLLDGTFSGISCIMYKELHVLTLSPPPCPSSGPHFSYADLVVPIPDLKLHKAVIEL